MLSGCRPKKIFIAPSVGFVHSDCRRTRLSASCGDQSISHAKGKKERNKERSSGSARFSDPAIFINDQKKSEIAKLQRFIASLKKYLL